MEIVQDEAQMTFVEKVSKEAERYQAAHQEEIEKSKGYIEIVVEQ